jgi:hypothetical protein
MMNDKYPAIQTFTWQILTSLSVGALLLLLLPPQ